MSVDEMIEQLTYNPMENTYGLVGVHRDHTPKIIAALKAAQAMRDDTYVGENVHIYSKKVFTESCVAWDTATKGDV